MKKIEDIDLLKAIMDSETDGIFVVTPECKYLDANEAGLKMFGYSKDELLGSHVSTIFHPDDGGGVFEKAKDAAHESFFPEYPMKRKDGSGIWVAMTVRPFEADGEPYKLCIKRDITARIRAAEEIKASREQLEDKVKRSTAELKSANRSLELQILKRIKTEDLLHTILKATSQVAGEEFLRTLIRHLAAALEVKYAFVAESTGTSTARTLAFWAKGHFADNFEYDLKDTPCGKVASGDVCSYPCSVQAAFPKDEYLVQMEAESYIGIPLIDSGGKVMGVMAALDTKPLADEDGAKALMRLFALRAALELQRKKAEDVQKKSEAHLQAFLDNTAAQIYMKDADGRFFLVNRWFEKTFKQSRTDIIGKTDYDFFPKHMAEKLRENDSRIVEANAPLAFEETVQMPDGELHTYLSKKFPISGMPGAICGISTDITERKKIEEALRESDKRLREAQAIAHVGSWDWDIEKDTLYWSDEIYRIFGLEPQQFGATYEAFLSSVHPDDREAVQISVKGAIENNRPYDMVHRVVQPDGVERIVNEKAEITRDADGRPVRMAGTVQDVTEHKRLEAEILKAQKLDSIGVLAGGIAHDFNNLLLGILGNVSIAKTFVKPDDSVAGILESIEKAALRTKTLTRQLLTFSKGGEPVREPVSIEQIIRDSAELVLRGSEVVCDYSFEKGLWPIDADQGQISQAVNNILLNAAQAMPDGGRIKVEAVNLNVDEGTPLPLSAGRYIKATIRDFGVGIPVKLLSKIFDPFFTTRKKASGLGLSVTYSIVKKHKGHIGVDSEVGGGTSFHLYLPASNAAVQENDNKLVKGRGRVLVMDDEELIREVSGEMLKLLGYEAVFAENGRQAIELFSRAVARGEPFDAVILDLTVPGGLGGKDTLQKLKEIAPGVKAIVSSGYSKDPIMSEYRSFGFCGVIAKPYRVAEFGRVVKGVISGEPPEQSPM